MAAESEKQRETVKPNYVLETKKYGVLEPKTNPFILEGAVLSEKEYRIENIPQEVIDICKVFKEHGGRAFLVGGSVRDAIMAKTHPGIQPKDFDLEVYGFSVDEMNKILAEHFGEEKVFSVGKSFGVLKVRIEGSEEFLDFASPRIEEKTGEGHKGITVTEKPQFLVAEAARRRDLTINAVAYDPLIETVIDPFGGIEDIENGRIRIVDEETFIEDPLRVLRVMQFAARFGFSIDDGATLRVCEEMVETGEMNIIRGPASKKVYFENEPWDEYVYQKHTEEERAKHKETMGFLYVKEGRVKHKKRLVKEDEKGLPPERISEELYKLILKGKKPSLGFEFAKKIGLVALYWKDLDQLSDEEWKETMEAVDRAAVIANREIKSGGIPTERGRSNLGIGLENFQMMKGREYLDDLMRKEIVEKHGRADLDRIEAFSKKLGRKMARRHMERMIAGTKTTTTQQARNIVFQKWGYDPEQRLVRGNEFNEGVAERIEAEARELGNTFWNDAARKQGHGWGQEEGSLARGGEQKALERMMRRKLFGRENSERFIKEGEESQRKLSDVAKKLAVEEMKKEEKRKIKELVNDQKVAIVLAGLLNRLVRDQVTRVLHGSQVEKVRVLTTFDETRFSPEIKGAVINLIGDWKKLDNAFESDTGDLYEDLADMKGDLVMQSMVGEVVEGEGEKWKGRREKLTEFMQMEKPFRIDPGRILNTLNIPGKKGGSWVMVVQDFVNRDLRKGLITKNDEDVNQAIKDYYTSLSTKVQAALEMLPKDQQNEKTRTRLWNKMKEREL